MKIKEGRQADAPEYAATFTDTNPCSGASAPSASEGTFLLRCIRLPRQLTRLRFDRLVRGREVCRGRKHQATLSFLSFSPKSPNHLVVGDYSFHS